MSWWSRGKFPLPYEEKITTKKQKLILIFIGPCGRINPAQNACRNTTGRLVQCLENTDFGTSYVCLCLNGIATTNADCG